jgi:hypothetical protein
MEIIIIIIIIIIMQQKYCKHKYTANEDHAKNLMRQQIHHISMPNNGKRTIHKET